MIIPSIDLMGGQTVQLRQGRTKVLEAGDPAPIARRFGVVGEIAIVDLDAALGTGDNRELIAPLLAIADCRVGGGIRDAQTALRWLDAGATRVVLGTAATPEVLSKLPRDRVIAALDAWNGEVVTHGWQSKTGRRIEDRMQELAPYVGEFLVTFVEREGTMTGLDLAAAERLKAAAGGVRLTVAGGVREVSEIGALDRLGIDAQIGMALYTGAFDLADALAACMKSDRPDGLWPTIVTDPRGTALGLAYSNTESLRAALRELAGVYWSRKRGLWRKGDTSGATQDLLRVSLDCDRDAMRFVVRTRGSGFCHRGSVTCFGADAAPSARSDTWGLSRLTWTVAGPRTDPQSYTARLLADDALLGAKLREEATELAAASASADVTHEAADLLYFLLVKLAASGVDLEAVERELDQRGRKVSRRRGDAKPAFTSPAQENRHE